MNALLARAKSGFEALTAREQWMITLAGWAVILGVGAFVFIEPLSQSVRKIEGQIAQSQQATQGLLALNRLKQEKLRTSPNAELERELAELEKTLASLNGEMARKVEGLVTAAQMSTLMEDVLKQSERLTLVSMASLPPQKLTAEQDAGLYIHPVQITLNGRYFDIVNYLNALEALPVKYYWRQVNYRVLDYPIAEITLEVYTLGESAVFIGGVNEIIE